MKAQGQKKNTLKKKSQVKNHQHRLYDNHNARLCVRVKKTEGY